LLFSGRAPSWKAIAICLLQNDFRLHKLGYTTTPGEWAQAALDLSRESASDQLPLWGIAVTSKGFSPAVLSAVRQRANGWCERCGLKRGYEFHHRRPRGMGGSKLANTNMTSNALMLCRDCHADIESERTAAINQGWLITQNHSPTDIPVYYRGAWVYLDDLGNLQPVQETL
jgi:5-methylcytosine-specific restriction protein A